MPDQHQPPVSLPGPLHEIVELFESLPEQERRENLVALARSVEKWAPSEGEAFDLNDCRKDDQCTDRVGLHVRIGEGGGVAFKVSLGPNVQTLTKAMTAILCQGLNGQSRKAILDLSPEFVPKIVGEELVRMRSRTIYYILDRLKEAARSLDADT